MPSAQTLLAVALQQISHTVLCLSRQQPARQERWQSAQSLPPSRLNVRTAPRPCPRSLQRTAPHRMWRTPGWLSILQLQPGPYLSIQGALRQHPADSSRRPQHSRTLSSEGRTRQRHTCQQLTACRSSSRPSSLQCILLCSRLRASPNCMQLCPSSSGLDRYLPPRVASQLHKARGS